MRLMRRSGIALLEWVLLVPVATRLVMAVQDRRVPGEDRPGYYRCPVAGCQQVLRLTSPIPCPGHPDHAMVFVTDRDPRQA